MKDTIFLMFTFLVFASGFSKQLTPPQRISGTVVDEKGLPMAGVSVVEKGTRNGTITDIDGKFTLPAKSGVLLSVYFLGYRNMEVAASNNLEIKMEPESSELNEVVVVGYGTQKKSSLTGAVTAVKLEDTESRPITDASQALIGKTPGVFISQTSGAPGTASAASIRVRGVGTLGNNNALVVIDGVPGTLSGISPSDIESVSILKDAAAAAIYGSRGANGVLLVTTKSGGEGITYEGYVGFQAPTRMRDYVTNSAQFMELYNLAKANEGETTPPFSQDIINKFRDPAKYDPETAPSLYPYLYPNTNWTDLIYSKQALITSHNLKIKGTTKDYEASDRGSKYLVSANYLTQDGVVRGTSADIYDLRLNLEGKKGKLSYDVRINDRYSTYANLLGGNGTVIGGADRANPMWSPYTMSGKYAVNAIAITPLSGHPLVAINEGRNDNVENNFGLRAKASYEIISGLKLVANLGTNIEYTNTNTFYPDVKLYDVRTDKPEISAGGWTPLSVGTSGDLNRYLNAMAYLDYTKVFAKDHEVSAMFGANQEVNLYEKSSASKNGAPSNEVQTLDGASTPVKIEGSNSKWAIQSLMGRLKYGFKERYYIESSFRYDGSSRFASGKRFGFFPSVSLGWNLSKEEFLKNIDWLSNIKLRGSYGQLGNQYIGNGLYNTVYATGINYIVGGNIVGGVAAKTIGNPDVTWEVAKSWDGALEFGFFQQRLTGSVEYYQRNTDNILRSLAISSIIGNLKGPQSNLASVQNTGWEFTIGYTNKTYSENQKFIYSIDANFTVNDNIVTDIPAPQIGSYTWLKKGRPINEFYANKKIGIFQSQDEVNGYVGPTGEMIQPNAKPGDIKYADLGSVKNGPPDGKIDGNDRTPSGNSIPKYSYGLTVSFSYKGIDFSMLWSGLAGVNAITELEQTPFFNGAGISKFWTNPAHVWSETNKQNDYPRLLTGSGSNQSYSLFSNYLIQDASFLRLRNVQLGYKFPKKWLEFCKLRAARVYVNAQNPITLTKYIGLDPERAPTSQRGSYTNIQSYSVGLKVDLF